MSLVMYCLQLAFHITGSAILQIARYLFRHLLHNKEVSMDPTGKVYVCGLLGTDRITAETGDDMWMATDFVAIRELIAAHEELSRWICGCPLPSGPFLLGDPACDRIIFNPPRFEEVHLVEPDEVAVEFALAVNSVAHKISAEDTLVVVLVGHGHESASALYVTSGTSNALFRKTSLERAVEGTKGHIILINTACYSGRWESKSWTLFAAAKENEESASIVASASDQFRGGIFTNALLAEHTDQFAIRGPCPSSLCDDGTRGAQLNHDFGELSMARPLDRAIPRDVTQIFKWMNHFRTSIGRTYTSAEFVFNGPLTAQMLPFWPLTNEATSLQKHSCAVPSVPVDDSLSVFALHPLCPVTSLPIFSLLSSEDEVELLQHARSHVEFTPPSTASEVGMILGCRLVAKHSGPNKISEGKKLELLTALRARLKTRKQALGIALNLGWLSAVSSVGKPNWENLQRGANHSLQRAAEKHGCRVSVLVIKCLEHPWQGAAAWLARIWEESGSPYVSPKQWEKAVDTDDWDSLCVD